MNCSSSCSTGCSDSCEPVNGSCSCKPGFTGDKCNRTCREGRYGRDCNNSCSTGCSDTCEPVIGSCSCKPGFTGEECNHTCPEGRFGMNCSSSCSTGCSDSCDRINGSCSCKPGFAGDKCNYTCREGRYGRDCNNSCSTGCSDTCEPVIGSCRCKPGFTGEKCNHTCPEGSYGMNCSSSCSTGCSDSCDQVNGSCSCQPGFTGDKCNRTCREGRYGRDCNNSCSTGCSDTCEPVIGSCSCKPGFTGDKCNHKCLGGSYGVNCSSSCSTGCSDSCDRINGSCSCKPGFTGDKCNDTCPEGSYGVNCSSSCSTGCSDTCDRINGSCSCQPGFTGDKCNHTCPEGSYGRDCNNSCSTGCSDTCEPVIGSCSCKPGFTGDKCNRNINNPCSEGCVQMSCDPESLECGECEPGWQQLDRRCDKKCAPGLYGGGCRFKCSEGCKSGTCNHRDGTCVPCRDDWTGTSCQHKIIYCPATQFNTSVGEFNTTRTPVGQTFSHPDLCHVDDEPLGTVECSADGQEGGNWSSFILNKACDYSDLQKSNISNELTDLIEGGGDIETVIRSAANITRNTTLNQLDVLLITNILESSTNLSSVTREVADEVLTMYSAVINTPNSTLNDAKERAFAPTRILRSLDNITGKIDPGPNGTERLSTETFVAEVWNLSNPNVNTRHLPIGLSLSASGGNQSSGVGSVFNKSLDHTQIDTAIVLPREFLEGLQHDSKGKDIRLSMNVYKDPVLFHKALTNDSKYRFNSKVISAKILVDGVEQTVLNGTSVTMIFLSEQQTNVTRVASCECSITSKRCCYESPAIMSVYDSQIDTGVDKRCGYWNFTISDWSREGCNLTQGESGRVVCTCDHLTNFAVLLPHGGLEDSVHSVALSVITILGLSLSIIGLSATLLSFIVFKKLREKHPQQTLFNLALAELFAWLIFLVGIAQTQSRTGCMAVAILLHYFLLASFMWMLAEAFLHYLLLVRAQLERAFTNRYMLKTGIPAWGLPLIPLMAVLAVDPALYRGSDSYCWMSVSASLYAFALPVGLIILFNFIIYILVVVSIFRLSRGRAQGTKGNKKRQLLKFRVPFLCFILFGLSWVFGFLAVSDAKVVFQYLFCLTSSCQGFLIFFFFTARNQEVRQLWRNLLCKKKRQERLVSDDRRETSTSKSSKTKTTDDIGETTTSM